jgi:hypothetical protein
MTKRSLNIKSKTNYMNAGKLTRESFLAVIPYNQGFSE